MHGVVVFRKVAMVVFTVSAFAPTVIVAVSFAIPRLNKDESWPTRHAHWIKQYHGRYLVNTDSVPTKIGPKKDSEGRVIVHTVSPKERRPSSVLVIVVVVASLLLTTATGIRTAGTFVIKLESEKPWFDHRVTMYICIALIEAGVEVMWLLTRVDLRLYIPDRADDIAEDYDSPFETHEETIVPVDIENDSVTHASRLGRRSSYIDMREYQL